MNEADIPDEKPQGLLKMGNFYLVGILVSLGQWGDAKALVTDVYQDVMTHFTHDIEYNNLKKVQVGSNLAFIENTFGIAKLIKTSHNDSDVEYRYYSDSKFILSVASKGDRVTAFSIISLDDSFYPQLHFSANHLGRGRFNELQEFSGSFNTDAGNIIYYQEPMSLGVNGLFLNRYLSFVAYGAHYAASDENKDAGEQEAEIQQLNKLILLDEEDDIKKKVDFLRQSTYPNVVTFGEVDGEFAADMLLTRNEYLAHFWGS